jgi:hypothetical protein
VRDIVVSLRSGEWRRALRIARRPRCYGKLTGIDPKPVPNPGPPGPPSGGGEIADAKTNLTLPGPTAPKLGLPAGESGATVNPIRITGRQELLLDALGTLARSSPGPWRGRVITSQAQLDYDPRTRTDLSTLSKLGFLQNDGRGYARTDKPYPCP